MRKGRARYAAQLLRPNTSHIIARLIYLYADVCSWIHHWLWDSLWQCATFLPSPTPAAASTQLAPLARLLPPSPLMMTTLCTGQGPLWAQCSQPLSTTSCTSGQCIIPGDLTFSKIQIFSTQGAQQSEQERELEGKTGLLHHPRRIRGHTQRGQGGSGHGPKMTTFQNYFYT